MRTGPVLQHRRSTAGPNLISFPCSPSVSSLNHDFRRHLEMTVLDRVMPGNAISCQIRLAVSLDGVDFPNYIRLRFGCRPSNLRRAGKASDQRNNPHRFIETEIPCRIH